MIRGRKTKNRDSGANLSATPPATLTPAEAACYLRILGHIGHHGRCRASDAEAVVIAARRLARLEMLLRKFNNVVASDQLIMGSMATEATD